MIFVETLITNKNHKTLIIFDDMISVMLSNKKLEAITTELFIKSWEMNISLVFIIKSYFAVPKNIN